MGNVLLFTPKSELSAEKNLQGFEQFCRSELTIFGIDLPFDENTWDLTAAFTAKGKTKTLRAIFSSHNAARAKKDLPAMSAPFLGFAKAYFRYTLSLRSSTAWSNRLAALRILDDALCEEGHDGMVHKATHDVFVRGAQRIAKDYQAQTASKIAGELAHIGRFLVEHELCVMNSIWVSPIKKPNDANIRVGKVADKAREEKLPSKEAIQAIAYIFQNPADAADVFVSSSLALLHCFPQRINEVARLPFDCEVEYDSSQQPQYGLREPGSKGFKDSVRWVVATMEGVARAAIRNLKKASSDARNVALWYESDRTKIYIPSELEYLREQEYLTQEEVSLLLYGVPDGAKGWCQREKIKMAIPKHYRFSEIERAVLGKLPKDFPITPTGLKYSETLFIARRFEMDATLATYQCLVDFLSPDVLTSRLGKSGSATSIFDRLAFKELDGSPICLNSHQIRHYLNTLAQSNSASQLDIAMWSGRADVSQNAVYDHVTHETIIASASALAVAGSSQLFAGTTNIPKIRVVAHRDDATGKLITGTAHATLYGMCRHDYAASPCQIHRDCLNCHEHVCVKGNNVKLENIRRMRDETAMLLAKAEVAEKNSEHGASRWVVHQSKTLAHCNELLDILENPFVQDGALIALAEVRSASQFEQMRFLRQEVERTPRKNKLLERMRNGKN